MGCRRRLPTPHTRHPTPARRRSVIMPEYKGMNLIMPTSDQEIRPYFEAAAQGRLVMRRCPECGLLRYPPGAGCPWCSSLGWEWAEVSGRGTIYSYEIVTQAIQPGFADW